MKFWFFVLAAASWHLAATEILSADLPLEARDDSGEDIISTSYVLPNQIFNDGKPYYASKDPISGQLDFNSKKPAGIETAVNEVIDPKEKIVLNNASPNIHDFLNLPVKYSSSKFVYPLVSSSYANLKYQGNNKNYITNKKPISVEASAATPPPSYHQHQHQQHHQQQQEQHNHFNIPTTKLMAVASSAEPQPKPTTSTSTSTSTSTTSTTTTTTSKKPAPTLATTTKNTLPPPTSTSIKTSIATSTSLFTPPKYTSVTRRPIPIQTTTTQPTKPTVHTTRKKFMPTKKYTSTSPTLPATAQPTNPLRFPESGNHFASKPTENASTTFTTTTTTTTKQITKPGSTFPTDGTKLTPPPLHPPSITEQQLPLLPNQNAPTSSSPTSTTRIPNLDPADVYQTLGQKNNPDNNKNNNNNNNNNKETMTLADIFNSLAEEESAVAFNNQQGNQGFDAQGNLMQPIAPSKPSPFAMQDSGKNEQPTNVAAPTTTNAQQRPPSPNQFNNDQKVLAGSQENYSNEYVSYQVQQPNVMQYRPAPGAINNVVISPGQHSASFVLGSQQQVGSNAFGSVEKEPIFGKERPVQYGTVINEPLPPKSGASFPDSSHAPAFQNLPQTGNFGNNEEPPPPAPSPYQQLPLIGGPNLRPQSNKPNKQPNREANVNTNTLPVNNAPSQQQTNVNNGDTQELLVSTNIRFPLNEEQSEEQLNGPVSAGPPAGPHVNGHAQPLSLQQIKQTSPVVFPTIKDEDLTQGEQYQGSSASGGGDVQIQQHEVVTMNQHKQTLSFPSTNEQHTPSTHMEPPPLPPQQAALQASVEHPDLHKRPHLNRPPGPPPPFAYNEYTRKPINGITRPNPDRQLPNILPQFRPNAKISSGHPSPNFNQEPGNIRIPNGPPNPHLRRPPPNMASPQFAHRRQPLMQQQRYPTNRLVDSGLPYPAEANRRVYRLPPYGGQGFPYADRMYSRRPMPYAAVRPIVDSYAIERHAPALGPEVYKTIVPQDPSLAPERMAAFEEEDLLINEPPQPVTPGKERKPVDESKLEPVVTLQMLQSQKKPLSLPNDDTGSGEIQVPPESESFDPNLEQPASSTSQNGLYVVYPMNGKKTDSKAEDALPAVAHVEPPTGSDYQNTPFSVIRDEPEEPLLKLTKKPQSLQQQTKQGAVKEKFPYPIEKPDLSFNELHVKKGVPGVLIAPRIVHGLHSTGTETPIAIAYTPTEPNPYRKHGYTKFSNVNLASSVIGEIRHDTQTEEGLSHDFDLRGQNFEKNFMAPFYPSVSLGSATSAPANGWNILPSTIKNDGQAYEKNKIDRADRVDEGAEKNDSTDESSKNDNFQPELQGGFKPIYPPGYKIEDDYDAERLHQHESNSRPLALASRMETTTSSTTSSTTTTTTIAPKTTSASTSSTTTLRPQKSTTKSNVDKMKEDSILKAETTVKPLESSTKSTNIENSTQAPLKTTPKPTQRKKTPFETSLEALLFGDDADFEGEARKQTAKAKSAPLSVPRMGPRSLKLS